MGVNFTVAPGSDTVDPSGGNVTTKTTIEATSDSRAKPLAKHLVLCIDSSTSMSGTKISNIKDGIRQAIDELDPEDKLSIVEFDTEAKTVLEPCYVSGNRTRAKSRVREIEADGGTDIIDGLKAAEATLSVDVTSDLGHSAGLEASTPDEEMTKWIMLLSDGKPSSIRSLLGKGPSDEAIQKHIDLAERFGEKGITIQSVGVGTDYSEPIMRGVAEATQGRIVHISNPADVKALFAETVGEASRVIETNPTLKLYPGESTPIESIYQREPSLIEFTPEHRGDHLEVDLSDIAADVTQEVLVEVNVPRGKAESSKTILDLELDLIGETHEDSVTIRYEGDSEERLTATDKERIDSRARRLAIEESPKKAESYLKRQESEAIQNATEEYIQELKEAEESGDDDKRLGAKSELARPTKIDDPDKTDISGADAEDEEEDTEPKETAISRDSEKDPHSSDSERTEPTGPEYAIIPSKREVTVGESLDVEVRNQEGSRVDGAMIEYGDGSVSTDSRGLATFQFESAGSKELSVESTSRARSGGTVVTVESADGSSESGEETDDDEGTTSGLEREESGSGRTQVALIPNHESVSVGQELVVTVRDDSGNRVSGVTLVMGDVVKDTDQQGTCTVAFDSSGEYKIEIEYEGYVAEPLEVKVD